MRLKHVLIGEYKNLKNFPVDFTGGNFMDVFVGKNGSGKSNFFEALILIFRHLYEFNDADATIYEFDYKLTYEIGGKDVVFEWKAGNNTLKINGRTRKTLSNIPLPDNILVYYSGQNNTISELLGLYQSLFSKKIKGAEVSDIRKFIGIGGPYKELLLSLILAQPEGSKAKGFLEEKLKIKGVSSELKVTLKRPEYALGNDEYDITDNDDAAIRYWGAKGISKLFLESIRDCISLDATTRERAEGYQGGDDRYIHYYDITKLQAVVEGKEALYLFRMLDNLKLIGMLEQVTIDIELEDGYHASISDFSDGQFQSVYIYAVTELFKESNCITLLDEPDAFLHPEWQFDLLKQVDEISEGAAQKNHVLMSTHSASTVCSSEGINLHVFDCVDGSVVLNNLPKKEIINQLSNSVIQYSEDESLLLINNVLRTSDRPVLFVEGPSDVFILNEGFKKLYPGEDNPILIQDAFDRGFLRTLLARSEIYDAYPNKLFFGLFDFDDAYDDWRDIGDDVMEGDVSKGLCKKVKNRNSFVFLLPIIDNAIRKQVWNESNPIEKVVKKPVYGIEHCFWGVPELKGYFSEKNGAVVFTRSKQKINFAEREVPKLDSKYFEVFKPIFDFILSECRLAEHEAVA
jgi:predicted ATPase